MPERAPAPSGDVAQQTTVMFVLWLGLAGCGVVYGGVATFVRVAPEPPAPLLLYGLIGAGVAATLGSFLLRPVLLSRTRIAGALCDGGQEKAVYMIVQGYVITWTLADTSAMVGLLLGIMNAGPTMSYGLIALGTGIVLAHGPTAHTIPDLLAAAEQERLRTQV